MIRSVATYLRFALLVGACVACRSDAPRADDDQQDDQGDDDVGEMDEGGAGGSGGASTSRGGASGAGAGGGSAGGGGAGGGSAGAGQGGGEGGRGGAPIAPDAGTPPDRRDAGDLPSASKSAGCGRAQRGTSSYVLQPQLRVAGLDRRVYLYVPRTYDPNRAYPLVFRWHGAGGNAQGGGMPIEAAAGEDAIVVAADGHDVPPFGNGWDFAEGGPDVALFDELVRRISESHCVDPRRIFSYGFSMGGGFSLVLGCVRGNVLRGIGVVAGGFLPPAPRPTKCQGHVAAFVVQGSRDGIVTAAHAEGIRNQLYLPHHGCMASAQPVAPSPCRANDGCLPGHPQIYCRNDAGHDVQAGFAPAAAWAFWKALPVEAAP